MCWCHLGRVEVVEVGEGEEVQLESSVARQLEPGAAVPDLTKPAVL